MAVIMTAAKEEKFEHLMREFDFHAEILESLASDLRKSVKSMREHGSPCMADLHRAYHVKSIMEYRAPMIEDETMELFNLFEMYDLLPEETEEDYERAVAEASQ